MIEGPGMILKGGMQICLCWMPGVARFSEERQIRQTEVFDQRTIGIKPRLMCCGQRPGKDKNAQYHQSKYANKQYSPSRWATHKTTETQRTKISEAPSCRSTGIFLIT